MLIPWQYLGKKNGIREFKELTYVNLFYKEMFKCKCLLTIDVFLPHGYHKTLTLHRPLARGCGGLDSLLNAITGPAAVTVIPRKPDERLRTLGQVKLLDIP